MPTKSHSTIAPTAEASQLLATAIECLIAFLDLHEPDPDLEEGGDEEATLGWPNPDRDPTTGSQLRLWPEDHDGENEPSLGWSEMEARFGSYDGLSKKGLEHEHDGSETSLGWQNEGSQRSLRISSTDDAEPSPASTTCIGSFHWTSSDDGWDQSLWAEGECDDREEEHDGREPDYDNEVDSWPNPMGPEVGARP